MYQHCKIKILIVFQSDIQATQTLQNYDYDNEPYLGKIINHSDNCDEWQGHSYGELDVSTQIIHDAVVYFGLGGITLTLPFTGDWGDHNPLPGAVLDLEGWGEPGHGFVWHLMVTWINYSNKHWKVKIGISQFFIEGLIQSILFIIPLKHQKMQPQDTHFRPPTPKPPIQPQIQVGAGCWVLTCWQYLNMLKKKKEYILFICMEKLLIKTETPKFKIDPEA